MRSAISSLSPLSLLEQMLRLLTASARHMSSQASGRRLADHVALVTASTDGIGLAVAARLLQEGAKVVVSSRKQQNVARALKQLEPLGHVLGQTCHVADKEQRAALLDLVDRQFGRLDALVSNAAVSPFFGSFLETPEDAFDKLLAVNVKAAFLLTREAMPLLRKSSAPSVVYVSSIGAYQTFPAIAAYSVTKTALLGLARAVALECAPHVRANCVCPGVIETRFSEPLWKSSAAKEELAKLVPLARAGRPEEVAALVAFLCSSDASYITGESMVVAGGHFSRL